MTVSEREMYRWDQSVLSCTSSKLLRGLVKAFLTVNLFPAFSFSDKSPCFVQAALPGDSGSEPQPPGEALCELLLRSPSC